MLSKLSITILIALFSSKHFEWFVSVPILSVPRAFLAQRRVKLVERQRSNTRTTVWALSSLEARSQSRLLDLSKDCQRLEISLVDCKLLGKEIDTRTPVMPIVLRKANWNPEQVAYYP